MQPNYSNNVVEYHALILDLETLTKLHAKILLVHDDSQLIIKQVTQEYKYINSNLLEYIIKVFKLLNNFERVNFEQISREFICEAIDLAQTASKYKILNLSFDKFIQIKENIPKEFGVLQIDDLKYDNWRSPIIKYLNDPNRWNNEISSL